MNSVFWTRLLLHCLWVAVPALLLAPCAYGEPNSTPSKPDPAQLVSQLGSASFQARDRARQALLELGPQSLPALREGLTSSNLEIRRACKNLLPVVSRNTSNQLLDTFVENGPGKDVPAPTGWSRFSAAMGKDKQARQLFAEISRDDRKLLELLQKNPKQAVSQMKARCDRIRRRTVNGSEQQTLMSVSSIAAAFYCARCAGKLDYRNVSRFYGVLYRPDVRLAVEGNQVLRRALATLVRQQARDKKTFSIRLNLVRMFPLPELEKYVRQEIKNQLTSVLQKSGDLTQLQRVAIYANQIGYTELLDEKIKPIVQRLAVKATEKPLDAKNFVALFRTAKTMNASDVLNQYLRPAYLRSERAGKFRSNTYSYYNQILYLIRNDPCEKTLKPLLEESVRKKMLALTTRNPDQRQLQQIFYQARSLGMEESIEALIRPLARKVIIARLESKNDLNNLRQTISQARSFGLEKTIQGTLIPIFEREVKSLEKRPTDVKRLSLLLNMARYLGASKITDKYLKPSLVKTIQQMMNKPVDARKASTVLSLARSYELKEALPLALKLAKSRKQSGYVRGSALQFVGRYGDKKLIAELAPLLKDSKVIRTVSYIKPPITTQARDIALATMVHLSGQDLKDYGFDYATRFGRGFLSTSYSYLGFSNDKRRSQALKKWKDWLARSNQP